MSSEDSTSEEEKISTELFTTRFGRNSVPTFLPELQVKVSKSVAQGKVSRSEAQVELGQNVSPIRASKCVLAAGISKSVLKVEIIKSFRR